MQHGKEMRLDHGGSGVKSTRSRLCACQTQVNSPRTRPALNGSATMTRSRAPSALIGLCDTTLDVRNPDPRVPTWLSVSTEQVRFMPCRGYVCAQRQRKMGTWQGLAITFPFGAPVDSGVRCSPMPSAVTARKDPLAPKQTLDTISIHFDIGLPGDKRSQRVGREAEAEAA